MSFVPTGCKIFVTEIGNEGTKFRALSKMTGTVTTGKHSVIALMKRMSLVIESQMINVVGGIGDKEVMCAMAALCSIQQCFVLVVA